MEVWVVTHPTKLSEPLYKLGLGLVDEDSVTHIKRFFRREDSCRCLIGRLLPRVLLSERGVHANSITFDKTEAGKPYFKTPALDPPLFFNVSHDNELVAMIFGSDDYAGSSQGTRSASASAGNLGVDVMKCQLPQRESFRSFVNTVGEALTPNETSYLLSLSPSPSPSLNPQAPTPPEALKAFYQIWTLKEAYTKALGLGLGFDFARIECDVDVSSAGYGTFTVDGKRKGGWEVRLFEVQLDGTVAVEKHGARERGRGGEGEGGSYVGVAMRCVGAEDGDKVTVTWKPSDAGGCKVVEIDAEVFVRRAVKALTGEECSV